MEEEIPTMGGRLGIAPLVAVLILSGASLSWAASPSSPSTPAPAADPRWVARYDFALEVDGKPSPDACFYQELDSRRILINAPEVSKVCIVTQEGQRVTAV